MKKLLKESLFLVLCVLSITGGTFIILAPFMIETTLQLIGLCILAIVYIGVQPFLYKALEWSKSDDTPNS